MGNDYEEAIEENMHSLQDSEAEPERNGKEPLRPLQLLHEDESGALTLHVEQLEQILQQDELQGRRLVVISVVGAFRKGKSFLLSVMLNYLRAQGLDGSWLSKSLDDGFIWRPGASRETTGILVWPEIISVGKDLSVLLLDTQGMFDEKTSFEQNSFVFTFATMLSSVQIFNVSQQIQMDDLRHLEVFIELGRLLLKESEAIPFQQLIFLVRDWPHRNDYSLGFDGGRKMLKEMWMQNTFGIKEKERICQTLGECFSDIQCCLMCYPGSKIAEGHNFDSVLQAVADSDFTECLEELLTKLLNAENMPAKKVLDTEITPAQFPNFVRQVFGKLQNDAPRAPALFECMIEIRNQEIMQLAIAAYETEMSEACQEVIDDIIGMHKYAFATAMAIFDNTKKFGGKLSETNTRILLQENIKKSYKRYDALNRERLAAKHKEELAEEVRRLSEKYKTLMGNACAEYVENIDTSHEEHSMQIITELENMEGFQEKELKHAVMVLQIDLDNQYLSLETLNRERRAGNLEKYANQLTETNESRWRRSALDQQQHLFELVGDRRYDCIDFNDTNQILERKVAYAIHGPPSTAFGIGYHNKKMEIVNKICKFIRERSREFSGEENILFACIFIFYVKLDFTDAGVATLFRIGKQGLSDECIFIDTRERMYRNWEQFINKNKLPKCHMCYPQNGIYEGDEQHVVKIKYEKSRACSFLSQTASVVNVTTNVVSLVSCGFLGAAALAIPVAGPLVTTAAFASIGSSVVSCGGSVVKLLDRSQHYQSIKPYNLEAFSAWVNIGITPVIMLSSMRVLAKAGFGKTLPMLNDMNVTVDDFIEMANTLGSKTVVFLLEIVEMLNDNRDGNLTKHAYQRIRASLLYYFHIYVGENTPLEDLGQNLAGMIAGTVKYLPKNVVALVLLLVTCFSSESILVNLRNRGFHVTL